LGRPLTGEKQPNDPYYSRIHNIIVGLFLGVLFVPYGIEADYHVYPAQTIPEKIAYYAAKWDVDPLVMYRVVHCESRLNPKAIGDGGKSRGLVQIHAPSHPYVTKAQAFDPDFALNFLGKNLSAGKGKMWTCWRIHFG
jgi:soluble lytic murein transglycosylase-like protein